MSLDSYSDNGVGISIHAGFPNAAEDNAQQPLDFNALLISHPSSTYCFRVQGTAHEDRGIFDGDIAVIDRALTPRPADLVVYFADEGFVITYYRQLKNQIEVWGVVTSIIHMTRTAGMRT